MAGLDIQVPSRMDRGTVGAQDRGCSYRARLGPAPGAVSTLRVFSLTSAAACGITRLKSVVGMLVAE